MMETIFGLLTALAGGVITHLVRENRKLTNANDTIRRDNAFLMVSLYELTSAIEFTDSVSDDSKLHSVAKEIKEKLKERIEKNTAKPLSLEDPTF